MHPTAGQGAVNAMQEFLVLANVISSVRTKNVEDLKEAFKTFREGRFPLAQESFSTSQPLNRTIGKVNSYAFFFTNSLC